MAAQAIIRRWDWYNTKALHRGYDQFLIIDPRSPEEYLGQKDLGEARKGHLPGAINLPFQQLLTSSGTLKSFDDINQLLSEPVVQKTREIVIYYTDGIRSALWFWY